VFDVGIPSETSQNPQPAPPKAYPDENPRPPSILGLELAGELITLPQAHHNDTPLRLNPLKRALDLAIAIPLLVFAAPMFLALMLLIRSHDGGPAFFRQKRIGLNGREFTCFKFRSMVMDAGERLQDLLARDPQAAAEWKADQKLRNDPRITPVGHFLRKTSLDELPQLLNIIRGDMSVVGPRPIVRDEKPRYGAYFSDYASVRPGVTGLWQVSGRNDTSYERRVRLDVIYARRHCFMFDIKILLSTIPAVLKGDGAY